MESMENLESMEGSNVKQRDDCQHRVTCLQKTKACQISWQSRQDTMFLGRYEKLIPLNPQQQIAARSALKEVDEASNA